MDQSAKSERKTRSMRLKESCDEIPKSLIKKGNYVRNPELETNYNIDEDVPRSTRKLRRHTLKEQNRANSEDDIPVKKHKQSSRTRKNHTETLDDPDAGDQHSIKIPEVKQKVKKGKKKKQEVVVEDEENVEEIKDVPKTKKKSKKRKTSKQSGEHNPLKLEENNEEINGVDLKENILNISNASNESFHSAAGSIKGDELTKMNGTIEESKTSVMDTSIKKSTPKSSKKAKIVKVSKVENDTVINSLENESLKHESNTNKVTVGFNKSMENKNDNNIPKIKLNDSFVKENSIENNCSDTKLDDTSEELECNKKCRSKRKHDANEQKSIDYNCSKIKLDDTYEKVNSNEKNNSKIKLDDTYEKRKSSDKNDSKIKLDDTYEKWNSSEKNNSKIKLDDTYEKRDSSEKNNSKIKLNDTYEKQNSSEKNNSKIKLDDTYEKRNSSEKNDFKLKLDDTYEKQNSSEKNDSKLKLDDTYEKRNSNVSNTVDDNQSMNKKRKSSSVLLLDVSNSMTSLNNTFDKSDKQNSKSLDVTYEKEKLNNTYDLDENIKSDGNKSVDNTNNSHISINSEDSKTENLINITPELVDSSNDEISFKNSPKTQHLELPLTPFKREGTYTKESPPYTKESDAISLDSGDTSNDTPRTPDRRKTLQSPGHTPFVTVEKKTVLNVTRSIEKVRRSSSMEPAPRATKVMFCSPTNQATVSSQIKRKVIKSNMKGSNKSFIFDSSMSELNRSGRKRSYTQNDAEEVRSKRSKLEEQKSVERLSRPRTLSATVKTSEPSTPSRKATKTKPENKVTRTKLPNFTALHQKQFDKMESLDQCQERKAKRARQLLTPTGTVNLLDRISPKEKDTNSLSAAAEKPKPSTPVRKSKTLTLTSLNPGYTRFGFKLNTSVNPFSVPNKEDKANESKPLPSRTGATSSRREAAKQTVMREKSFTERNSAKRNENRTFIKGVRTNRRFQLQMQMRNVN